MMRSLNDKKYPAYHEAISEDMTNDPGLLCDMIEELIKDEITITDHGDGVFIFSDGRRSGYQMEVEFYAMLEPDKTEKERIAKEFAEISPSVQVYDEAADEHFDYDLTAKVSTRDDTMFFVVTLELT